MPHNLAEARDAVRDGHARGETLLFCGGRSKLAWLRVPRVNRVIETARLNRLIRHDAGDMTAVVEAGMPVAALQEQLRQAGQWLAIDPPLGPANEATLGGIFSTNDSGPWRMGYGSLRELVIGITVILADGTIARSGGNVIKNVAGYDMCKLFCGAMGTLGMVFQLTVRLHPMPRDMCTVSTYTNIETATELAVALMASPLEPVAVDYCDGQLAVAFAGAVGVCGNQAHRARVMVENKTGGAVILRDDAHRSCWYGIRAVHASAHGSLNGRPMATGADDTHEYSDGGHTNGITVLRVGALPTDSHRVHDLVCAAANDTGLSAMTSSHLCLGLHTVQLSGRNGPAHLQCIEDIRRRLSILGAYAVIRRTVPGVDQRCLRFVPAAPLSRSPSVQEAENSLMRRIKMQFDPKDRCAPGVELFC